MLYVFVMKSSKAGVIKLRSVARMRHARAFCEARKAATRT